MWWTRRQQYRHLCVAGRLGLPANRRPEIRRREFRDQTRSPSRLLVSKNGPTPDCSSSGAVIKGFKRGSTITRIGIRLSQRRPLRRRRPPLQSDQRGGLHFFGGCAGGSAGDAACISTLSGSTGTRASTLPGHRGQRLHAFGTTLAHRHYLARGFCGFVAYVESTNLDSLKACFRAGYRSFGSICVLQGIRSLREPSPPRDASAWASGSSPIP